MDDKGRGVIDVLNAVTILVLCMLAIFFSSCKSSRECADNNIVSHDTITITQLHRDSIHIHDSVYTERFVAGDSIVMYKYIQRVEYRDMWHHDSIYIHHTDTLYNTVERIVTQKPTIIERSRSWIGGFFIISAILIGCYFVLRMIIAYVFKR